MNDAERNLIAGLFQRIRGAETAYRDPEAEAFIADQVARQPHAAYAMAQTLVVQNQSLEAAKARIEELEREVADAGGPSGRGGSPWGPRGSEPMGAPGGGMFGRQGVEPSRPYGAPPPQPHGTQQPLAPEPSRGGGFLSGALQTAAGVAGGALLFEGVRSMFGGLGGLGGLGGGEAKASEPGDVSRLGGDAKDDVKPEADGAPAGGEQGGWFGGLLDGVGGDGTDGRADDAGGGDDQGGGNDDWI